MSFDLRFTKANTEYGIGPFVPMVVKKVEWLGVEFFETANTQ